VEKMKVENLDRREPLWGNRSEKVALKREQREQLRGNHRKNQATGKEGEDGHRHHKRSPQERENGCTPVGYLGRAALRREMWHICSKQNCEASRDSRG
jgi:hypothetical protein